MTTAHPVVLPQSDREASYAAAVAGLRALDARERSPRRFGADAGTRWASFKGALTEASRIDLLLRDAAVTFLVEINSHDFAAAEVHGLGVAVDFTKATDELHTWTPPAAPKRNTLDPDELYAALVGWTPAADEDAEDDAWDDDEAADPAAERPEGATVAKLTSEVGATNTLVNKALKQLLSDGRIERVQGRPARYVAVGDEG